MHGFASGPESQKGRALAAYFGERHGIELARLDGRVPSFEHLRLSAIIATIRDAVGGPDDRAVAFGSSLGGLAVARAAERDARICAVVLLAPAFRMIERWQQRLGDEAWRRWQTSGWLEVDDHARGGTGCVDFELTHDVERVDARGDGWPDVRVPTLVVHGRRDEVVDPGCRANGPQTSVTCACSSSTTATIWSPRCRSSPPRPSASSRRFWAH
jgi:hypothetical protein